LEYAVCSRAEEVRRLSMSTVQRADAIQPPRRPATRTVVKKMRVSVRLVRAIMWTLLGKGCAKVLRAAKGMVY